MFWLVGAVDELDDELDDGLDDGLDDVVAGCSDDEFIGGLDDEAVADIGCDVDAVAGDDEFSDGLDDEAVGVDVGNVDGGNTTCTGVDAVSDVDVGNDDVVIAAFCSFSIVFLSFFSLTISVNMV